jgi:beta-aspartyl-dipeptidase (metallo-type)
MAGSAAQRARVPDSNVHMMILRCGQVLAPEPLGARDLVIAGERIVAVADPGVEIRNIEVEALDLRTLTVTPGFIDNHVHTLGGGGGLGFASRAPEVQTSQLTRAGITAVIGMLGFDATSKDMRALVAKTKAFREDGISAYALTGATLEHPVPTLTGRIRDDIAFVEEIIGVGEISVSELGYAYDSNGPGHSTSPRRRRPACSPGGSRGSAAISACRCRRITAPA